MSVDKEAIRARLLTFTNDPTVLRDIAALLAEVKRLTAQRDAVLALHKPKRDNGFSLVQHAYCSCGAMESYIAADGYRSIGPAHYPCPTVRALGVTESTQQENGESE